MCLSCICTWQLTSYVPLKLRYMACLIIIYLSCIFTWKLTNYVLLKLMYLAAYYLGTWAVSVHGSLIFMYLSFICTWQLNIYVSELYLYMTAWYLCIWAYLGFPFFWKKISNPELGTTRKNISEPRIPGSNPELGTIRKFFRVPTRNSEKFRVPT